MKRSGTNAFNEFQPAPRSRAGQARGRPDRTVRPPTATTSMLRRPRLFDLMDRAIRHRLTAVIAPAGAGKTLLVATWLRAANRRAAWVTLDERDNDPMVFWHYLVDGLERAMQGARLPHVPAQRLDDAFGHFMNVANQLDAPLVMVIDDVHLLTNREVLDRLGTLLRHGPDHLRLILVGRDEPALPLARLRVAGEVADLGFADLICTPDEARDLFHQLGVGAPDHEVETIVERTEGWMTGLQLAALWWHAQPSEGRHFRDFTGTARIVADYLHDEVLPADDDIREVLLQTCVLHTLNGDLADSLTRRRDGARVLDRLERENALVTAVDPRRRWFRYRPLLREYLRGQLDRLMPDEVAGLLGRAAHWYAAAGMTVEALQYAAEAKDWEYVAALLVSDGDRTVDLGVDTKTAALLDRIPEPQVTGDPRVAEVLARARLRAADPDGAEPYLKVVDRTTEGFWTNKDQQIAHELRRAELRLLQGCLRGEVSAVDVSSAQASLAVAAEADDFHRNRPAAGATAFQLALAQLWRGEWLAARYSLERALREGRPAEVAAARAWYAVTSAAEGRLADAEDSLDELAATTAADNGIPLVATGDTSLHRLTNALISLQRDRVDEAFQLLHPAAFPPMPPGEPPLAEAAALTRARILTIWGEFAEVRNELRLARRGATMLHGRISHAADIAEFELLLREGDLDGANKALLAAVTAAPIEDMAVHTVSLGRLHLAEGQPKLALAAVRACLDGTSVETTLLDVIGAHLVAASAYRSLGQHAVAKDHIEYALSFAERDGLVRVFVDAGRTVRALLTVMVPPDGPYAGQRATILHHFETQSARQPGRGTRNVTLTASETAVLQYLPSHLTNEEIAEDLCVSINTVKSHLRSLYRKLSAAHRREAIAQARQLGLLPDIPMHFARS